MSKQTKEAIGIFIVCVMVAGACWLLISVTETRAEIRITDDPPAPAPVEAVDETPSPCAVCDGEGLDGDKPCTCELGQKLAKLLEKCQAGDKSACSSCSKSLAKESKSGNNMRRRIFPRFRKWR